MDAQDFSIDTRTTEPLPWRHHAITWCINFWNSPNVMWEGKIEKLSPLNLRFDLTENNFRLAGYDAAELTQETALDLYWNEFDATELAQSIWTSGYFPQDPMIAIENGDGTYTTIEGNRRLAAIMGLLGKWKKELDAPTNTPIEELRKKLQNIPVLVYPNRESIPASFIAFKHHNAPFRWKWFARATHIANLIDTPAAPSLSTIANVCGDREYVTEMHCRAFQILEQARTTPFKGKQSEVVYNPKWRYNSPHSMNFSSLMLGLERVGIRDFLGILNTPAEEKSPIQPEYFGRLRQLLIWALGDNRNGTPPRLLEGTNDWGLLEALVYDDNAIDQLDTGRSLSEVAQVCEPWEDGDTSFMTSEARTHLDLVTAESRLSRVLKENYSRQPLNALHRDLIRSIHGLIAQIMDRYSVSEDAKSPQPWKIPD